MIKDKIFSQNIPPIPGNNPEEIAKNILLQNKKDILWAGTGHYHELWTSDSALSFTGAVDLHGAKYWQYLVDFMIKKSLQLGRIPCAFMFSKGVDIPYARVDNLPMLLFIIDRLYQKLHQADRKKADLFLNTKRKALQQLVTNYSEAYLTTELVDTRKAGDWMDTIGRPSSSWANIWVLAMLKIAKKLELKTNRNWQRFEKDLMFRCFKLDSKNSGYFKDHQFTEEIGADACILALYLSIFNEGINQIIINKLESLDLFIPYPMRATINVYNNKYIPLLTRLICPGYHDNSIWPHLGIMYIIGLVKSGKIELALKHKKKIDKLIMKYHNFLEVLNLNGDPYRGRITVSDYGFTMGAGLYLELINLLKP